MATIMLNDQIEKATQSMISSSPKARKIMDNNNGVNNYYKSKIERLEARLQTKLGSLRRLQAQRNELNDSVRALKDELLLLQESLFLYRPTLHKC